MPNTKLSKPMSADNPLPPQDFKTGDAPCGPLEERTHLPRSVGRGEILQTLGYKGLVHVHAKTRSLAGGCVAFATQPA